jgi:eukaryotic-like serine/threonine-protein kinase
MGEVYRARDTKLGRDVAIKVVSDGFGHDPERIARFEREAHMLAALNHPHIAAIYGFEESGGSQFLVMELVEGENLADRLTKGALPLEQALRCAIEIASALDKAHRHGITHRDLKPGNIMLTKSGAKLLDFGLAKNASPAAAGPGDLSAALTMTSPITAQGTILGTFQYMAPEQLEGHEADPRTDIFAFGAVLYEMLTGKKAFEGKSQASLIAAILDREPPPISSAQPLTPPALDRVVKKCLAKDPDDRWQSAADLYDELKWIAESGSHAGNTTLATPGARSRGLWRRLAAFAATAVAAGALVGTAVWLGTRTKPAPPPRVSRLQITPPSAAAPTITALTFNNATRDVAITPDGTGVVYLGANGTAIFVRALDQLDATPLTGLGAPIGPFVSPDGQWIGFADGTNLKKVTITGGSAVPLVRLGGVGFRGATWGPDGTIVFATADTATGLQRVADGGGEPTVLTQANRTGGEADHLWPEFLPGGQAVLFTIADTSGGLDQAQIAVLDLRTGVQTTLIRGGTDAHYVPSGHLIYGAAGTLRAVGFDLVRLAVVGTPVTVVPQIVTTANGAVDVAVAGDGTFVYVPGGVGAQKRMPVWVDRQGRETPIPAPPRPYDNPRISPDGARAALHAQDDRDIWLLDLVRGGLMRFTFDPVQNNYPVWVGDRRLVFSSLSNLFTQPADRASGVTRLTESRTVQGATSSSPDGTRLVFQEDNPKTGFDVMQLRLDKANEVTALVQTQFTERNGEVSPDGRWLAYEADDSKSFEIYVQPFPDATGGGRLVSTGGGRQPLWSRNRNNPELFYLAPGSVLMRVGVGSGPTWSASVPEKVLDGGRYYTGTGGQAGRSYDIALDGQRFLMIKPGGGSDSTPSAPASLVVVQHFDEELKRLLPIKN